MKSTHRLPMGSRSGCLSHNTVMMVRRRIGYGSPDLEFVPVERGDVSNSTATIEKEKVLDISAMFGPMNSCGTPVLLLDSEALEDQQALGGQQNRS